MSVAKVTINGSVVLDMTDATATAPDITSPKTAYIADGSKAVGTGSGGGGSSTVYTGVITGTGNSDWYVRINNTTYTSGTFTFDAGDEMYVYNKHNSNSNRISLNGEITSSVYGSVNTQTVILPPNDITVEFSIGSYNDTIYIVTCEIDTLILNRTISGTYQNSYLTTVGMYAFAACDYLSSVNIPNCSVISQSAFYGCDNLQTINAPLCNTIGYGAFDNCDNLLSANFQSVNGGIGSFAFRSCIRLSTISIPSCTIINSGAFQSCSSLTEVEFPACTEINPYAFGNCYNLISVSFPELLYLNSAAATGASMQGAFYSCQNLSSVYMPKVTSISAGAFAGCSKLSSFSFNSGISFLGGYQFLGCGFVELNLSSIARIDSFMFASCKSLTTVSLSNYSTIVYQYAFQSCTSLGTVYMPNVPSVSGYAFSGCTKLYSVTLPNCSSIGSYAFYNCSSMTSVYLPKVVLLYNYAFQTCKFLGQVILSNVSTAQGTIYPYAFSMCYNLLSVYLLASTLYKLSNANAFVSTPISTYTTSTGGINGSIFVPESLYNSYITSTNWTTYSARIVSMTSAEITALLSQYS